MASSIGISYSKWDEFAEEISDDDDDDAKMEEPTTTTKEEEEMERVDLCALAMAFARARWESDLDENEVLYEPRSPVVPTTDSLGSSLNDLQARDWLFRLGVDSSESWQKLWRLVQTKGKGEEFWDRDGPPEKSSATQKSPSCRCLDCIEKESTSAGLVAQDCVTCWRCKNYFNASCVAGFAAAVSETNVVSLQTKQGTPRHLAIDLERLRPYYSDDMRSRLLAKHASEIRKQFPTATVWRTVAQPTGLKKKKRPFLLYNWGECPRCGASLGGTSLPKLALPGVAMKVFLEGDDLAKAFANASDSETDMRWTKRAVAYEVGACLELARASLVQHENIDDAIEFCTRAICAANYLRSLGAFDDDVDAWFADAYFRAHYARSALEATVTPLKFPSPLKRLVLDLEALHSDYARFHVNVPKIKEMDDPKDMEMDESKDEKDKDSDNETTQTMSLPGRSLAVFLERSDVVETWISRGVLYGLPACRGETDGTPEWFRSTDRDADDFQLVPDAESRDCRLWVVDESEKAPVADAAYLAMTYDARWLLRSSYAAKQFWNVDTVRRTEQDPENPFRCGRLHYGAPSFVVVPPKDDVMMDEEPKEPHKDPVQVAGAHESMVFRSLEVIDGLIAYNILFRISRICAKVFVLVDLKNPDDPIDPSLDLAVLQLAQTAVKRCTAFLGNPALNVLDDDWPELGRPLAFFGIQSQFPEPEPTPRPGEGRKEAAEAAFNAMKALGIDPDDAQRDAEPFEIPKPPSPSAMDTSGDKPSVDLMEFTPLRRHTSTTEPPPPPTPAKH